MRLYVLKMTGLQAQVRRVGQERLEELTVLRPFGSSPQLSLEVGTKLYPGIRVEVVRRIDGELVDTLSINLQQNRVLELRTYTKTKLGDKPVLQLRAKIKVKPDDRFYDESLREYEELMGLKRGAATR